MQRSLVGIALLMAAAAVGCSKDKQKEPAMTPAAGTYQEPRSPAESETQGWTETPSTPQQPSTESGAMPSESLPGQSGFDQPGMEQPSGAMPSAGQPSASMGAMDQDLTMLAESRCRREVRCNHVGASGKYATVEECQASMLSESQRELSSCLSGLQRVSLTECTSAIDASSCDKPMDKLSSVEECKSESLCM